MLEGCSEPLELWRVCSAGSRGDLLLLEIGRRDFMPSAYHRYHLITISFINLVRVGDVHTLHTPRERALVRSKAPLVPPSLTAAVRGSSEDRAGGQRPRSGGCSDCNPAFLQARSVSPCCCGTTRVPWTVLCLIALPAYICLGAVKGLQGFFCIADV